MNERKLDVATQALLNVIVANYTNPTVVMSGMGGAVQQDDVWLKLTTDIYLLQYHLLSIMGCF